jgi:hypothetical protein
VSNIIRAISIRQPYVELILRGEKREEYRSRATRIRERVYIYASLTPSEWDEDWQEVGKQKGELPTGKVVGTVEVTDCYWHKRHECYAYTLSEPQRLQVFLKSSNQPQPGFWRPQFEGTF